MADAWYPKHKEALLQATSGSSLAGTVKAILVDTGTYTYSAAHEFRSSLSGTGGTAQTLGSKTFTNGLFDAADITFTAVAGTVSYEAVVLYIDNGSAAADRLVAYIDSLSDVTSNGGDITISWNASGVAQL